MTFLFRHLCSGRPLFSGQLHFLFRTMPFPGRQNILWLLSSSFISHYTLRCVTVHITSRVGIQLTISFKDLQGQAFSQTFWQKIWSLFPYLYPHCSFNQLEKIVATGHGRFGKWDNYLLCSSPSVALSTINQPIFDQ